jgi:hypothetical protein
MALGLMGLLDLSIVTDQLIALLGRYRDASPLWTEQSPQFDIDINGAAPDAVRTGSGCVLSVYLFHVAADKFQRNLRQLAVRPPAPVPGQPSLPAVAFQPMALNLYYLVTAWAGRDYVHEQKAMSIAMKCFHENPVVAMNVVLDGQTVAEELTLTMEMETADELGRLWQSITTSARLAAAYKVSVVFLAPEAGEELAKAVKTINIGQRETPPGVTIK